MKDCTDLPPAKRLAAIMWLRDHAPHAATLMRRIDLLTEALMHADRENPTVPQYAADIAWASRQADECADAMRSLCALVEREKTMAKRRGTNPGSRLRAADKLTRHYLTITLHQQQFVCRLTRRIPMEPAGDTASWVCIPLNATDPDGDRMIVWARREPDRTMCLNDDGELWFTMTCHGMGEARMAELIRPFRTYLDDGTIRMILPADVTLADAARRWLLMARTLADGKAR